MPNLLIIDDAVTLLRTLQMNFESNFNVFTASNSKDGIRLMFTAKPDIILLDLLMPKISGIQILRAMRNNHIDIPTIVLTGVTKAEIIKQAYASGAIQVLTKPCSHMEIKSVLIAQLNKSIQKDAREEAVVPPPEEAFPKDLRDNEGAQPEVSKPEAGDGQAGPASP